MDTQDELKDQTPAPAAVPAQDAAGASALAAPPAARPDDAAPPPRDTDAAAAARIDALERELQTERIEKGRLRAANDELRKAKDEIARLKAENAKLSARRPDDYLSAEDRAKIDNEQLDVIGKVIDGRMGDFAERMRAENERLAQASAAVRKTQFDAEVERLAPGLVQTVAQDHRDDWTRWSQERRRAASVRAAFESFDAATVADFLQEFAQSKGIHPQGDGLAARPSASYSPRGGARPAPAQGDSRIYTADEVNAALRAAAADCDAGRITLDERRAIQKKYDAAYAEGRVVAR